MKSLAQLAFAVTPPGTQSLCKSEAERPRGRVQFASNHLFGWRFRNCPCEQLNVHINRGFKKDFPELQAAFCTLNSLMDANELRLVDARHFGWADLYVDAAFEPGGHSGIGGLLPDKDGKCLGRSCTSWIGFSHQAIWSRDHHLWAWGTCSGCLSLQRTYRWKEGNRFHWQSSCPSVPDQMQVWEWAHGPHKQTCV